MALNKGQLAELKIELDTDPEGIGYTDDDPECADLLNAIGSETLDQTVIDGQELSAVVVIGEYTALSASMQRAWMTIVSAGNGQVDVSNAAIRIQIAAVWGPGTDTRAALVALQSRNCSRAETLFGAGVSVDYLDVGRARLSGEGY